MNFNLISDSLVVQKKSKFIGMLFKIDSKEDVASIITYVKDENKGYRHVPYAYKVNNTGGKSDDKEPGGIGLAFFNILERNSLDGYLLLVVRYYGGVKLGASNLLRAYNSAANLCIKKW